MKLTGNELTFECEGCGKDKFPEQLTMTDLLCIECVRRQMWGKSPTFSESIPVK